VQPSFIQQRCSQLYESLLQEIALHKLRATCPLKEIEHCFMLCDQYCSLVDTYGMTVFDHIAEEIFFFKKIKPRFHAEVIYYRFCYHAALYKAQESDPVRLQQFISRELLRLERFIEANRIFYTYYKQGLTDHDTSWFTRQPDHPERSRHDPLIASLLAHEKYNDYLAALMAPPGHNK
jgi:hypothetical protein